MNDEQRQVVRAAEEYVERLFGDDNTGHDAFHMFRVRDKALKIAEKEGGRVDSFVIEIAALLHDLGDHKLFQRSSREMITDFFSSVRTDPRIVEHVITIAEEISFKGAGTNVKMSTAEGEVVQDADRLDALGAVGIARTFAYGGNKKRPIYDPAIEPVKHRSFEDYKKSTAPTINHFYEKLLLLKDRMNTRTGREMAESAHRYMEEFLERFYAEWKGEE